ncbi:hypothetical protein M9H77_17629 [Catharanthus roseus]|uniref:Uncharacterized protein n=1 Tax=Catharanthus roseus TaxID=4058 RepID=A0ACC0B569_CATRO|nr:hypothetical protein M9H77_17629 [Catharanthus roseus]
MDSASVISISYLLHRSLSSSQSQPSASQARLSSSQTQPPAHKSGPLFPPLELEATLSQAPTDPSALKPRGSQVILIRVASYPGQCCGYAIQTYIPVMFGLTIRLLDHCTSAGSGHVWDDPEYQAKCEHALKNKVEGRGDEGPGKHTVGSLSFIEWEVSKRWLLGADFSHEKLYGKLMFIEKEGEFVDERANEFWLKKQKEHEHRTSGAPMPTDHELILKLNEGLKKGHTYGFSAAESACLRGQSQYATVGGRPFLGD